MSVDQLNTLSAYTFNMHSKIWLCMYQENKAYLHFRITSHCLYVWNWKKKTFRLVTAVCNDTLRLKYKGTTVKL